MDHHTFVRCIVAFQQRAIITDRDEDVILPSTTNEASANTHPVLEVFLPIPFDYFLCLEFCHIKSKQFMDTYDSICSIMYPGVCSIHEEPYVGHCQAFEMPAAWPDSASLPLLESKIPCF